MSQGQDHWGISLSERHCLLHLIKSYLFPKLTLKDNHGRTRLHNLWSIYYIHFFFFSFFLGGGWGEQGTLWEELFHFFDRSWFYSWFFWNEVWDGTRSKLGWFITKTFLCLSSSFLSPSILLGCSYTSSFDFNNNLACFFSETVICLILFSILLSITITTFDICSLCLSSICSTKRSWTNGARHQTIQKFSFWNSTRDQIKPGCFDHTNKHK